MQKRKGTAYKQLHTQPIILLFLQCKKFKLFIFGLQHSVDKLCLSILQIFKKTDILDLQSFFMQKTVYIILFANNFLHFCNKNTKKRIRV